MTSYGVRLIALSAGGLTLGAAFAGCGTSEMWFNYDCSDPAYQQLVPAGGQDPCKDAGADAAPDAPDCTCVRWGVEWSEPTWLWVGPTQGPLGPDLDGTAPLCPPESGEDTYHGYADLVAPPECLPCSCDGPPIGACALPSTLTAHDVICQDLDQPHKDIPFDAPGAWDGGCTSMDAIPAGSGVESLSIAPLAVNEGCAVGSPEPARAFAYWKTVARGCHGRGWSECGDIGRSVCVRNGDAPSPDFKLCISQQGDLSLDPQTPCPDDWPDQHVLFRDYHDSRACSECACQPVGSVCAAFVSVYSDSACQTVPDTNNVTSGANPDFCINMLPAGQALGSKSAIHPTYSPGVCLPVGGDFMGGTAEPVHPTTFCCQH